MEKLARYLVIVVVGLCILAGTILTRAWAVTGARTGAGALCVVTRAWTWAWTRAWTRARTVAGAYTWTRAWTGAVAGARVAQRPQGL